MRRVNRILPLLCLAVLLAPPTLAAPMGTAFTYQGELKSSGAPTNSSCNFQFSLWDAAGGGTQIGSTQTVSAVSVTNGLFTVSLDFGAGAFTGNARWLAISVQCGSDPLPTALSPRQAITPAPYALFAASAPGGGGLTLPFTGTAANQGSTTNGIDALAGIGAFNATNSATTGLSHGIMGKTSSTWHNATGVLGVGLATSGLTSGVQGYATASPSGTGVVGLGQSRGGWFSSTAAGSYGIEGLGVTRGVSGSSSGGDGVYGTGTNAGVYGVGTAYGVVGHSDGGFGVVGEYGVGFSPPNGTNAGVYGTSASTNLGSAGVRGEAANGFGVQGTSTAGDGIYGSSSAPNKSGVFARSTHASGYGLSCDNLGGGVAFRAFGMAQVHTLQILGADLAESFPIREKAIEPGTVLMLDEGRDGGLRVCDEPYSRLVAGVVSGAHGLDAAVVLKGASFDSEGEAPVALSGRVWVKCDATKAPIRIGDLLTTAGRAGHAMVAADRDRADGSILGKAMTSLEAGTGMVLVLVSLQ